ncbi:hypothetical protein E4T52_04606 [Aureobasidium sp. EXF-3400]|nr:hypothetical protein E4T51_03622 [Aureobasidium sp. EXF-12344]KAI4780510.1 hypothetical protein E4T52_04606 [Aureobasidium sp. EXF-3400]
MQTRKHEAVPPFLQERNIDPTTTLAYIKTEISAIYTAAKDFDTNNDDILHISQDKYIKLYTAIFDYFRRLKTPSTPLSLTDKGRIIFQYLDCEIRVFCKDVRDIIFTVEAEREDMSVTCARKVLMKFARLASLVRNLMSTWDRHWVRREWLEKKIQSANVEELHKAIWKEEVLEKGMEGVVDAVAILREAKGDMTEYDAALVKDVVKGLSGLGVTLDN